MLKTWKNFLSLLKNFVPFLLKEEKKGTKGKQLILISARKRDREKERRNESEMEEAWRNSPICCSAYKKGFAFCSSKSLSKWHHSGKRRKKIGATVPLLYPNKIVLCIVVVCVMVYKERKGMMSCVKRYDRKITFYFYYYLLCEAQNEFCYGYCYC